MNISILVHGHKPLGTTDEEIRQWYDRVYAPLFFMLRERSPIKVAVYNNFVLWKWLLEHGTDFIVLLRELLSDNRLEILGGAAYEPLLPLLSEEDSIAHFGEMSRLIENSFDILPRGVWIDSRIWEPSMVSLLSKTDVDFVVLDALVTTKCDFGPLITEDRGNVLRVFPSHQAGAGSKKDVFSCLTAAIDKDSASEATVTIGLDVTDEMLVQFDEDQVGVTDIFAPPLDRIVALVKEQKLTPVLLSSECDKGASAGTFFRSSLNIPPVRETLASMPGALSIYRKMLQVCRKTEFSGRCTREIRSALLRGQSATGLLDPETCLKPTFRDSLWFNLLQAEDMLDSRLHGKGSWVDVDEVDYNGDGKDELLTGSRQLNAYFIPHRGGALFEIDFKQSCANVLDVIVPDDSVFSSIFVDLFPDVRGMASLEDIYSAPEKSGWGVLSPYESRTVSDRDTRIELGRTGDVKFTTDQGFSSCSVSLEKTFRFVADQPSFKVRYRIINHSDHDLNSPFAVAFGMKVPDCESCDSILIDERPFNDVVHNEGPLEMVQSFTVVNNENSYRARVQFTMCSELLIVPSADLGHGCNGVGFVPQWAGPLPAGEILELDFTVEFDKFGGFDA